MWDRRAEYIENHDGDTVKMVLDQGFDDTKTIQCRLLAVPAPELHQLGGEQTQDFVEEWYKKRITTKTRWNFIVTTVRMKVADHEQKTLDRYVCTVTSMDVMDNLNMAILKYLSEHNYPGGVGSL